MSVSGKEITFVEALNQALKEECVATRGVCLAKTSAEWVACSRDPGALPEFGQERVSTVRSREAAIARAGVGPPVGLRPVIEFQLHGF